jgi:hypothetical protein
LLKDEAQLQQLIDISLAEHNFRLQLRQLTVL